MAVYYISACHDCKTRIMWEKCPEEAAQILHEKYHHGHSTELGSDIDDDFYDAVWEYESEFEGLPKKQTKRGN